MHSDSVKTVPESWMNWIRTCQMVSSDMNRVREKLRTVFPDIDPDEIICGAIPTVPVIPDSRNYDTSHRWMKIDQPGVEVLHTEPTVAVIHDLLTPSQCQTVIDYYRDSGHIRRANVHDSTTGSIVQSEHRTNSLMSLNEDLHPVLEELEHRLETVTGFSTEQSENLQLLWYRPGEEFKPHDDFFHHLGENSQVGRAGQRVATLIVYLNEIEEGGGTEFPNLGIVAKPSPGSAVYFEYTDGNGVSTDRCRHAGSPVVRGEKWALTKWYRQRTYR